MIRHVMQAALITLILKTGYIIVSPIKIVPVDYTFAFIILTGSADTTVHY